MAIAAGVCLELYWQAMSTSKSNANRPRLLADMIPRLTEGIFGKKNLLFGKMLAAWPEIAGADIAAQTVPLDLKFQRTAKQAESAAKKTPGQAILHLAVQPAYALELSYQQSLLIERINMFFGYAAIKDIRIVQNSEVMNNKRVATPSKRPLTMQESEKLETMVSGVQENDLQTALKNLGKAIISRQNSRDKQPPQE